MFGDTVHFNLETYLLLQVETVVISKFKFAKPSLNKLDENICTLQDGKIHSRVLKISTFIPKGPQVLFVLNNPYSIEI